MTEEKKLYSQGEEEKHILDVFQGRLGRFLDIGAYDGVTYSNTLRLVELGWNGVMIEPSPTAFVNLMKRYPNRTFRVWLVLAVVGFSNGPVVLHHTDQPLSTTEESQLKRWEGKVEFQPFTVGQISLGQLFRHVGREFDFVSIDTEGTSRILFEQMLDTESVFPELVCVEHNDEKDKIIEFGARYGYAPMYSNDINVILRRRR